MDTELTFGQKAVGFTFNPSGNMQVSEIKDKYAVIIDFLNDARTEAKTADSDMSEVIRLLSVAITEAQTAQMWAVKAITWNQ